MRVKARAVILVDGRLIVAEQRRRGRRDLSLPGGRVGENESVIDALTREVMEETELRIVPGRLLYVFEIVASVRVHALELIFLAETGGVPNLGNLHTLDLNGGGSCPAVRPPILGEIATDAASGWRQHPRWLGNLARRDARVP